MSKFTTLPTGWNNNRFTRPAADPAPDVTLARIRPAAVFVAGLDDWFPAVWVEDEQELYLGHDAFRTQEEALRVAEARARDRMEHGDG